MGKLTQGLIPAFRECPFKDKCKKTDFFEHCTHEGDQHQLPFSCAVARLFDIMEKNTED